jgi:hypothetical protein
MSLLKPQDATLPRIIAVVHHGKIAQPTSAMGQKRTLVTPKGMSALPPKADIPQHRLDVCFVPQADIGWGFVRQVLC